MSQAKFKRFNFSLTNLVSKDIDEISLLPRDFKCSRSDVLKAAIFSFKELSEKEQVENLRKVCVDSDNA